MRASQFTSESQPQGQGCFHSSRVAFTAQRSRNPVVQCGEGKGQEKIQLMGRVAPLFSFHSTTDGIRRYDACSVEAKVPLLILFLGPVGSGLREVVWVLAPRLCDTKYISWSRNLGPKFLNRFCTDLGPPAGAKKLRLKVSLPCVLG